jgi:GH18 family chitinase
MTRTRGAQAALAVLVLASLLALSFQLTTPKAQAEPGKKIVGYAAGWSVSGRAQAEALDGSKYTILIYAFLGVSGNACTADWAELEYPAPPYVPVTISATKAKDVFDGLKANKSENSNLKVLLSIGGGGYALQYYEHVGRRWPGP